VGAPHLGRTDEAQAEDGAPADPEAVARAICLRQLTAAPRTRAQLEQAMHRRNVPADVAERVLDRLAGVGLVDDVAFAESWVRSRHTGRGLARRALAHELRQRGVAEDVTAEAVAAVDAEDEAAAARDLVARRLPGLRGRPYDVKARRLAGMLARKGYPAGLASRVVREALASEREERSHSPGAGEDAEIGVESQDDA
jgi:regulatory protein